MRVYRLIMAPVAPLFLKTVRGKGMDEEIDSDLLT